MEFRTLALVCLSTMIVIAPTAAAVATEAISATAIPAGLFVCVGKPGTEVYVGVKYFGCGSANCVVGTDPTRCWGEGALA